MKEALRRLIRVKASATPIGKIDRRQIRQAIGVGAIAAPLSAYGTQAAATIQGALPAAIQGLAHSDAMNGIIGFVVGGAAAVLWKILRNYESM